MALKSQIFVVLVSVQLYNVYANSICCDFYLMFERQIYLKLVGAFVAINF